MPTVLRVRGYRLGFFSNEGTEPPHVHVHRAEYEAKYWLSPVELARNRGFSGPELTEIAAIVQEHRATLLGAWHDYFDA